MILILNKVKINVEDFFRIRKTFKVDKAYFNEWTKEELQNNKS